MTAPAKDRTQPAPINRRQALVIGVGALAAAGAGGLRVAAADPVETHGLSAFGDLKYPADFKHFDYVNPERAERRPVFADRPEPSVQSILSHLQFAQQLHSQG